MIGVLFLAFVAFMACAVAVFCVRYLQSRTASIAIAGMLAWLVYVGLIGYFGIVRNTAMRPPGVVFLFVPILVSFLYLIARLRSPAVVNIARAFPPWLLVAAQAFRVFVELFIHQLWIDGLVPKMLTFEGSNVDIYIGASAPFVAWLSLRGRSARKVVIVWNVLGLAALANVVCRAVLTTAGPLNFIHAEVPNRMIGAFPFIFIAGFFVPLAVVLHALSLRATD